jgi:flagellar transcriptional activator FlhD
MKTEQILAEIHEANLSYLALAQSMLRNDRASALVQLGMSDASAETFLMLSPAQLARIAESNALLHRFDMNDEAVFDLLTNHGLSAADRRAARVVKAVATV